MALRAVDTGNAFVEDAAVRVAANLLVDEGAPEEVATVEALIFGRTGELIPAAEAPGPPGALRQLQTNVRHLRQATDSGESA